MATLTGQGTRRRTLLYRATCAALLCAAVACDLPEEAERPTIETAYLLDRVNGTLPPGPVCAGQPAGQTLRFESIALADDGTYGRLQETQVGSNAPVQQEERGDWERTTEAILLRQGATVLATLTLLDSAGGHVRRIHTCGDTLRYVSARVGEVD